MLDGRTASALNKIIQNFYSKKKGQSEGTESPERGPVSSRKADRLHDLRLLPSHWRHDSVLDSADLFSITLRNDNVQVFGTRWDEILLFMTKIPSDDVLEGLQKLSIRESDQLKTVLELDDMEIHPKITMHNCQKLKTMVKKV